MRCKIINCLLIMLVTGVLLIGGCGPKNAKTTTPPTSLEPTTSLTTTPPSTPPVETATPEPPTTPPVTPTEPPTTPPVTPTEPEAPRLQSASPSDGAVDIAVDVELHFLFSLPMDHASVADAISLYPDKSVDLSWQQDDKLLIITPAGKLNYGTQYSVQFSTKAKSAAGVNLEQAIEVRFVTEKTPEAPAVIDVTPKSGSFELDPDFYVRVTFSAPMDAQTVENALQVTPQVKIKVAWEENNTVMIINAPDGWDEEAIYSFVIDKQAQSESGIKMKQPYSFILSAGPIPEAPVIVGTEPKTDSIDVKIHLTTIKIFFSQPMDRESVISALRISPDIYRISNLIIEWKENDTELRVTVPIQLEQGVLYEITVLPSAKSVAGVNMEEEFTFNFHTTWFC